MTATNTSINETIIDPETLVDVYIRGRNKGVPVSRLVTKNFPHKFIDRLIQKLSDKYRINPRSVVWGPSRNDIDENKDDYEIHNYKKLDKILVKLSEMVVAGKRKDADTFGSVAACVLDPDNRAVYGINLPAGNNKRYHAERVAMTLYEKEYGEIPAGSIIITTCSPCSEAMDERYGESCTDLINQSNVRKVYCGYHDPTQDEEQRQFNIMETGNTAIRDLCETFAATFLDNVNESWTKKYKKSINCSHPRGFSQRAHCAGRRARSAGKKTKSSSVSENIDEMAGEIHIGVSQALAKKGYQYLGGGIDKQAFLEPGTGQVLIVFGYRKGHNEFSPDQRMFIDWINYCNKNANNPHLPKFSGFESFQFQGKNYIQARMEPLRELPDEIGILVGHLDEVVKKKKTDYKKELQKVSQFATHTSSEEYNNTYYELEDTINYLGGKKAAANLLTTIYKVKKFGAKHGFTIDLHRGNYMSRKDGTIVVNDPFVLWIGELLS